MKVIFSIILFLFLICPVIAFEQSQFDFSYTTPTNYSLIPTVNSSDFWDNLNFPNTTQIENSNNQLNIKTSWLTTFGNTIWCALTGCTMTGNLTTSEWFNGKFNWTTGDNYNSFDGSTLLFNQSKLEVTYYNATSVDVVVGTLDSGDVDSTKIFDEVSLNISETNANPGLDIRFNFTGVSDFNQLIFRFKTDAESDHKTSIQLWDFVNNVWCDHDYYIETTIWDNPYMPIWDSNLYIGTGANEGDVWVRVFLDDMGKLAHTHYYDFVQLSKGLGTYSSIEGDPLSYHKDENINATGFNITADYFFGDGSELTGISTYNSTYHTTSTYVNQDVKTTASPTFVKLTLGNLDVDSLNFNNDDISSSTGYIQLHDKVGIGSTYAGALLNIQDDISGSYVRALRFLPTLTAPATSFAGFLLQPQLDINVAQTSATTGLYINDIVIGSGASNSNYKAIYISNIDNSVTNYAIYTNLGDISFGDDIHLRYDNKNLFFGATKTDLQISSDGTNPVYNSTGVHTFYNSSGLGTIRAGRYITGSYAPDISENSFLDKLNNINDWIKEDKSIDYSKHYAYVQTLEKDPNNCWDEINYYQWEEDNQTITSDILPEGIKDYEIIYRKECGTKLVDGLDLEKRAGDMEAMIYELKQENDLLKSELCKKDMTYSWCK